jgi:hypothetical protein
MTDPEPASIGWTDDPQLEFVLRDGKKFLSFKEFFFHRNVESGKERIYPYSLNLPNVDRLEPKSYHLIKMPCTHFEAKSHLYSMN